MLLIPRTSHYSKSEAKMSVARMSVAIIQDIRSQDISNQDRVSKEHKRRTSEAANLDWPSSEIYFPKSRPPMPVCLN